MLYSYFISSTKRLISQSGKSPHCTNNCVIASSYYTVDVPYQYTLPPHKITVVWMGCLPARCTRYDDTTGPSKPWRAERFIPMLWGRCPK